MRKTAMPATVTSAENQRQLMRFYQIAGGKGETYKVIDTIRFPEKIIFVKNADVKNIRCCNQRVFFYDGLEVFMMNNRVFPIRLKE